MYVQIRVQLSRFGKLGKQNIILDCPKEDNIDKITQEFSIDSKSFEDIEIVKSKKWCSLPQLISGGGSSDEENPGEFKKGLAVKAYISLKVL